MFAAVLVLDRSLRVGTRQIYYIAGHFPTD
jgi:hypothetical protein